MSTYNRDKTLSAGEKTSVTYRRRLIAELLARYGAGRLTCEEISDLLANRPNPIINEKSGKPFSKVTISKDILFIEEVWRGEMAVSVQEHKSTHLARLEYLYRANLAAGDLDGARKVLADEAKLLGLNAPVNLDVAHRDVDIVDIQIVRPVTDRPRLPTDASDASPVIEWTKTEPGTNGNGSL